ncbi:hypothetical protein GCM10009848_15190 [Micromonospora lupini]
MRRTDPLRVGADGELSDRRVEHSPPHPDIVPRGDRLLYRRPYGSGDFVLADTAGRELVRQPLPEQLVQLEVSVAPR